MTIYKLLFANQSIDTTTRYKLVRETKMYLFLDNVCGSAFTYRVHKTSLNVKGIMTGENGYRFDVPRAISLTKI
jgi:hypothetical protein